MQATIAVDFTSDQNSFLGVKQDQTNDASANVIGYPPFSVLSEEAMMVQKMSEGQRHASWIKEVLLDNAVDLSELIELITEIEDESDGHDLNQCLLPYKPTYKWGMGFDVEANQPKASPFIEELLYFGEPESLEGQDGKIRTSIIQSAKDFARDISVNVAGKYDGAFGPSVAAEMSMSNSYSIQSNEVIMRASHSIDLGKTIMDPTNIRLGKQAMIELATDKDGFRQKYGTHFIIGFTKKCSMDVFFKRKTSGSQTKTQVAAELEVDGGFYAFSAGMELAINSGRSDSKTEISVNYFGANDQNWIEGLSMGQLKQAVVDFPENCAGNVADYILWPYDNIKSYQGFVTMVKTALKLEELKPVAIAVDQPFDIESHTATPQQILSSIFTEAIIECKIIQNTLDSQITFNAAQQKAKEDIQFEFQLYEMALMDYYNSYKDILDQHNEDRYEQIGILREARQAADSGVLTVTSRTSGDKTELDIMKKYQALETDNPECLTDNCSECSMFSLNHCQVCDDGYHLNSQSGKCDTWKLLFRQSKGTYLQSGSNWLKHNEDYPNDPNYSILFCLDDSYKVDGSFTFKLAWPQDLPKTNVWTQESNPVMNIDGVENYKDIKSNYKNNAWGGLQHCNHQPCLLKGSLNDKGFYAVGATEAYQSGIPGPEKAVKRVELSVLIPGQ